MSYPPPPGGFPPGPGYPPGPTDGYPSSGAPSYPNQGGPWVPGGPPPPAPGSYGMPGTVAYPTQPGMPTPGGGSLGFGGPSPGPTSAPYMYRNPAPAPYPSHTPSPYSVGPPGPTPSPYPTGPPGPTPSPYPTGPPGPTSSPYSTGPPSYPSSMPTYPPPSSFGSHHPTPAYPSHGHQPTPGGYRTAAPPVPTAHTHHAHVQESTKKMAALSVTGKVKQDPPTQGTVVPFDRFNAEADAKALRTAMKGFGTDEKAIIYILACRSNSQRQQIKTKFKTLFGKDLIRELKSELSGKFEDVVLGLMMTPPEYDANELREAVKGLGTREDVLIEILCTRTNDEIQTIKQQYKTDFGRDIERDVASDTSGHFKRLLTSMLTGSRPHDNGTVDRAKARADAQTLYQAGEARWGTDESKFNIILASRTFSHLRVVFEEYSKLCKYDIEQSISREMSGDLKSGMLTIVKCVRDKSGYFAESLYKSMKGLGTDDRTLVRVMVTRCEVDMVQIKEKFYKLYHQSLGSFIKGDTGGDYRRILLALSGDDY